MTSVSTPLTNDAVTRSKPLAEHWWLLLVLVATGWPLGLVLQSGLIARGARRWHRRVVMLMIPLALAMVVTAVPMMQVMLRSGQQNTGFQPIARMLVVYDVASLLCLTGPLSFTLANVRRPALHRRALSATALSIGNSIGVAGV
jgi:hypothetical protein